MHPKMNFEQELLNEIKGLNQLDLARIIKLVHFVKYEIFGKKKTDAKQQILSCAGMLKNMTDEERDIFNQALKRKSLFSNREIRL